MSTNTVNRKPATPPKPDKPPKPASQLEAVTQVMKNATKPLTLTEIAKAAGELLGKACSEASVSARVRDLRKAPHGGMKVLRHRAGDGTYSYQAVVERPSNEVATPADKVGFGPVPSVLAGCARPISFGLPRGNVEEATAAAEKPGTPVAGSRAAAAFIESLKAQQ
jgi:hypothetical protein